MAKAQLYGHSSPDEDPESKDVGCFGEQALHQQLLQRKCFSESTTS